MGKTGIHPIQIKATVPLSQINKTVGNSPTIRCIPLQSLMSQITGTTTGTSNSETLQIKRVHVPTSNLFGSLVRNLRHHLAQTRTCYVSMMAKKNDTEIKVLDALQEQALTEEQYILVNENDDAVGSASKASRHRVCNDSKEVKLHRAFSAFLFNSAGDMLMQRRSEQKVRISEIYISSKIIALILFRSLFPICTQTLAAATLYMTHEERVATSALGIRNAAQRRLNDELDIPMEQITPEYFHYLTRIHYKHTGDGVWGEHEIGYILFLQQDVDLNPNLNEVSEMRYIKRNNTDDDIGRLQAP
uniref:isopentenyl-diphosphate Delta-isomerase n=1 Tax=Glossina pallidipes TaxID=7398 RepID=A0A1A9Z477_GLOPL